MLEIPWSILKYLEMCPNHSNSHGWQQNHLDSALFLNPKSECTAKGSAVPKVFHYKPVVASAQGPTMSHVGSLHHVKLRAPNPLPTENQDFLGGPKKIGMFDQLSGHMDPPKSKCCAFRMENIICHDGWRASYSAARLGIAIDLASEVS